MRIEVVGEGGQGWRRPRRGWGGGVCLGDDQDDDYEEDKEEKTG